MRWAVAMAAGAPPATPTAKAAPPSRCSAPALRASLVSFVAAFDRGDLARLDALFAPGTSFEWYSSNAPGLRVSEAARNRGSLRAYFRRRHLVHDRLRLVSFVFTGNSSGYGNAAFTMRRAASDYRRGDWFRLSGKAAARCSGKASVQFIVLSLGGPGSA